MSQFVKLPGERTIAHSPVALLLIDFLTGLPPIGRVAFSLQEETETDLWSDVAISPVRNSWDVYSYPGLGRTANPDGRTRTQRARIDSDYYDAHPVGFLTHLYNDNAPLQPDQYATGLQVELLVPNSRYPFPSHFPHIRGRLTRDTESGPPIVGAEIQHQSLKVFTTPNGEFTLPVQIPAQDTQTTEKSKLNEIKVQNARGYARAILKIRFDDKDNFFRVDEIIWKDSSAPPRNYEATLTLITLNGSDDLPADLPVATKISLVKFTLLIDIPPLARNEIDNDFAVDPSSGFQQFQRIVIPTS